MKLYFQSFGEGRSLIILHGLFGSGDNWLSHARQLSSAFRVIVPDQRNHGRSAHSKEMNYELMASDLLDLIAEEGLRDVTLLGHSMGGKTVMHFAQTYPWLVDRMVVADMGVKAYPPHHDRIFEGLFGVRVEEITSRREAEERLSRYIQDPATLQFLLKNLYWVENGRLAWRFNLQVLFDSIGEILKAVPEEPEVRIPILFMRGGRSEYIRDEDLPGIIKRFPGAEFCTIEGAGHWLHAEAPEEFMNQLAAFLV